MVKKAAFTIGDPRRNQTSFDMVKPLSHCAACSHALRSLCACALRLRLSCQGAKPLSRFNASIPQRTLNAIVFLIIYYILFIASFTLARRVYNEKTLYIFQILCIAYARFCKSMHLCDDIHRIYVFIPYNCIKWGKTLTLYNALKSPYFDYT